MILLISTCKNKLHEYEFVKPIENTLPNSKFRFKTKHYKDLSKKDLDEANRIIICGTSLLDNEFAKDLESFRWIKNTEKPVLGICAGAQIISQVFGAEIKKKTEIGFFKENFKKEFLGITGENEVYHLHNNYTSLPRDFVKYTTSEIPQAIKHASKPIYATLFHPEVRNKEMLESFLKL